VLTIRDATLADAEVLCLAEKAIAQAPGFLVSRPDELVVERFRDTIGRMASLAHGKYIVAEAGGQIVGHALLEPMALEALRHVVRLNIAVHPGHQRQGVGETMLGYLIEWATTAPLVEKIELNVRATNQGAVRLYQKLGFHFESRLGRRIRLGEGQYLDDFEMGLFVKAAPTVQTVIARPIGWVRADRREAIDDLWDEVNSRVELDPEQFGPEALHGLEAFSHAEVVFHMNRVDPRKIETGARHPRDHAAWPKVGIFAQRAKNRPNQLGTTIGRILRVEHLTVWLAGLDAIEGTPVLDIKPWVQEFGPRGVTHQPPWITELMRDYWTAP
jgi:tRNA (Thr-GGU) A37 N-methylase/ribosomal protein S18 acetylase RimI-like enzyme